MLGGVFLGNARGLGVVDTFGHLPAPLGVFESLALPTEPALGIRELLPHLHQCRLGVHDRLLHAARRPARVGRRGGRIEHRFNGVAEALEH